jgi:hypothetical protein
MKRGDTQVIDSDRGLGTAYARWSFYQRVQAWAEEYGVESALEGPVDGMAGIPGVHSAGLARRGVRVVAAVSSDEAASTARKVYSAAAPGGDVDVRVVNDDARMKELPASDLVLVYHGLPFVDDWRRYLTTLGGLARKVLIVTTHNPRSWGLAAASWLGGSPVPMVWKTETLAPALWQLGRVRHHVYFDAPWWPDLFAAPGQNLVNRLNQMGVITKRAGKARRGSPEREAIRSDRYVYGPDRWPYFEGPGWRDELLPALSRLLSFEGAVGSFIERLAHLHAFVVDMRPRTPQARRRLGLR